MEEIAVLKSEIDKLNKIISILIDQNSVLKSENSDLKTQITIKTPIGANDNIENGTKSSIGANDNIKNGTNYPISANDNFEKGTNCSFSANDNIEIGTNYSIGANDNIENGTNSNNNQFPQNSSANQSKLQGADLTAPHTIEISKQNVVKLGLALRGVFPLRAKLKKLYHVAQELLLLHNNGSASSDELRRVAGLSRWGYAKHAPSLRQKNLIYRHSHKKYMLTDFAKEIIKKVFGR